jgi:hypothetical protein
MRARAVTGCRALDIMHVAAARLCDATMMITADNRQGETQPAQSAQRPPHVPVEELRCP